MSNPPQHPFLYELTPTARTERRVCPFCKREQELVVMSPERRAPLGMQGELILECTVCHRLAIPAGIVKRLVGIALVVPFLALIGLGLAAAAWMLGSMITSHAFDGGFAFVALLLAGIALLAGRPAVRTLLRLVRPGALLPLGRTKLAGREVHDFSGEL